MDIGCVMINNSQQFKFYSIVKYCFHAFNKYIRLLKYSFVEKNSIQYDQNILFQFFNNIFPKSA